MIKKEEIVQIVRNKKPWGGWGAEEGMQKP